MPQVLTHNPGSPSSATSFAGYLWGILFHPAITLRCFLADPRRMPYGLYAVLIFAGLYSIASLVGYWLGRLPYGWEPFIKIPTQQFFLWQSIYLIPATLVSWIFYAGCIQLLSKPFGGKGGFEDTFALLGLTFFAFLLAMQLPDWIVDYALPRSVFNSPMFYNFINPLRLIAGTIWIVVLHILAVQRAQALSLGKAAIVTLVAVVPYVLLTLTYIH